MSIHRELLQFCIVETDCIYCIVLKAVTPAAKNGIFQGRPDIRAVNYRISSFWSCRKVRTFDEVSILQGWLINMYLKFDWRNTRFNWKVVFTRSLTRSKRDQTEVKQRSRSRALVTNVQSLVFSNRKCLARYGN